MLARAGCISKQSGRLDHHVNIHLAPRQVRWIFLGQHFDRFPVNDEFILCNINLAAVFPVITIVFEQVRQRLRIRQVIDRHNLQIAALPGNLKGAAPDPPETINRYFRYRHTSIPPE